MKSYARISILFAMPIILVQGSYIEGLAQEIKLTRKAPAPGTVIRAEYTETSVGRIELDGLVKKTEMLPGLEHHLVCEDTYADPAKDAPGAVRKTRYYEKAVVSSMVKDAVAACQGKKIAIVINGNKVTARMNDGKNVGALDAPLLFAELGSDRRHDISVWDILELLPTTLKTGVPVDLELKGLVARNSLSPVSTKGTCTLVRQFTSNKRQISTIHAQVTAVPRFLNPIEDQTPAKYTKTVATFELDVDAAEPLAYFDLYLLAKGADTNLSGPDLNSPLHLACANGDAFIAKILLNRGATVGAKNSKGQTAADLWRQKVGLDKPIPPNDLVEVLVKNLELGIDRALDAAQMQRLKARDLAVQRRIADRVDAMEFKFRAAKPLDYSWQHSWNSRTVGDKVPGGHWNYRANEREYEWRTEPLPPIRPGLNWADIEMLVGSSNDALIYALILADVAHGRGTPSFERVMKRAQSIIGK